MADISRGMDLREESAAPLNQLCSIIETLAAGSSGAAGTGKDTGQAAELAMGIARLIKMNSKGCQFDNKKMATTNGCCKSTTDLSRVRNLGAAAAVSGDLLGCLLCRKTCRNRSRFLSHLRSHFTTTKRPTTTTTTVSSPAGDSGFAGSLQEQGLQACRSSFDGLIDSCNSSSGTRDGGRIVSYGEDEEYGDDNDDDDTDPDERSASVSGSSSSKESSSVLLDRLKRKRQRRKKVRPRRRNRHHHHLHSHPHHHNIRSLTDRTGSRSRLEDDVVAVVPRTTGEADVDSGCHSSSSYQSGSSAIEDESSDCCPGDSESSSNEMAAEDHHLLKHQSSQQQTDQTEAVPSRRVSLKDRLSLAEKQLDSNETEGLICLTCLKRFSNCQNLRRHLRLHITRDSITPDIEKVGAQFLAYQESAGGGDPSPASSGAMAQEAAPHPHVIVRNGGERGYSMDGDDGLMCSGKYFCDWCPARFDNRSAFRIHESTHKGQKAACYVCDKTYADRYSLRYHLRTHGIGRQIRCEYCNKSFSKPSRLESHVKAHHDNIRDFKCSACGKAFKTRVHLETHFRQHSGEKPFPCLACGARFRHKFSLVAHQRSHDGEKPFCCEVCGKTFREPSTLKAHRRVHTGDRPYKCDLCHKSFTQRAGLNSHRQTAHPPPPGPASQGQGHQVEGQQLALLLPSFNHLKSPSSSASTGISGRPLPEPQPLRAPGAAAAPSPPSSVLALMSDPPEGCQQGQDVGSSFGHKGQSTSSSSTPTSESLVFPGQPGNGYGGSQPQVGGIMTPPLTPSSTAGIMMRAAGNVVGATGMETYMMPCGGPAGSSGGLTANPSNFHASGEDDYATSAYVNHHQFLGNYPEPGHGVYDHHHHQQQHHHHGSTPPADFLVRMPVGRPSPAGSSTSSSAVPPGAITPPSSPHGSMSRSATTTPSTSSGSSSMGSSSSSPSSSSSSSTHGQHHLYHHHHHQHEEHQQQIIDQPWFEEQYNHQMDYYDGGFGGHYDVNDHPEQQQQYHHHHQHHQHQHHHHHHQHEHQQHMINQGFVQQTNSATNYVGMADSFI